MLRLGESGLIRIRKLLSSRLVKLAATLTGALALLLGTTGTANAAIYWDNPGVQLVNQASQQCLDAQGMVPGCMAGGTSWIRLESAQPDADGHARVQIITNGPSGSLCLGVAGQGPSQIQGSLGTRWETCETGGNNWDQVWTMITAAPAQNVGNPAGLKHFINFHSDTYNVCLDGGIGVYGFPGGCVNDWQVWNIYTNKTSEPWRGY
ncbi:hypothetical protein OG901_53630 [Streptomyces mirabilis]|uniref:hypothetical protein n=1 Tax=Streptomyces mirabilis TaxID=68239 RepID=UPI002259A8D4|nr:hypothetical protein [Streptomyces mirabilis]MCX5356302.1 hypothetical protein [Streptomyces mirabilis]